VGRLPAQANAAPSGTDAATHQQRLQHPERLRHTNGAAHPDSEAPALRQQRPPPGPFSTYVNIDDTDCFAITFYANYFKWFQRCLEARFGGPVAIVAINNAKFNEPTVMGDLVHITCDPLAPDEHESSGAAASATPRTQWFSMTATTRTGQVADEEDVVKPKLCVSAHVCAQLPHRNHHQPTSPAPAPPPPSSSSSTAAAAHQLAIMRAALAVTMAAHCVPRLAHSVPVLDPVMSPLVETEGEDSTCRVLRKVQLFSDELTNGTVGVVDVMKWFNTNRSHSIGGAAGLRALQEGNEKYGGILVVVSRINDVQLLPPAAQQQLCDLQVGSTILSFSRLQIRRRGTAAVFTQQIWGPASAAARERDGLALVGYAEVDHARQQQERRARGEAVTAPRAADTAASPTPPPGAAGEAPAGGELVLIAQGEVICLCISEKMRRLIKIPEEVLQICRAAY